MLLQAPRGMKMGTFLAFLNSRSFRVEWDLTGLVLRSCRIGATSSCRNWTRIPLGTEHWRSLLPGSYLNARRLHIGVVKAPLCNSGLSVSHLTAVFRDSLQFAIS
jgi:hypothetical protein